jgi:hypothetical protein
VSRYEKGGESVPVPVHWDGAGVLLLGLQSLVQFLTRPSGRGKHLDKMLGECVNESKSKTSECVYSCMGTCLKLPGARGCRWAVG